MAFPFGINFEVDQETIDSYDILLQKLDSHLEGEEARKWNYRAYVTRKVFEQIRNNNLTYEVGYSLKDVSTELPDLIMVHFNAFSRLPDAPQSFESPDWSNVLETKHKTDKTPMSRLLDYFEQNPSHSLVNQFSESDETELRYFLETVFSVSYEKFMINMREYNGVFCGVRDENNKLIAMGHAYDDDYNGIVHFELDHVASTFKGAGLIATIGLISEILERYPNQFPVITAETKVDEDGFFNVFGNAGMTLPPHPSLNSINSIEILPKPHSAVTVLSKNPLQLIRRQVTIGESDKYFDLLVLVLTMDNAKELYDYRSY